MLRRRALATLCLAPAALLASLRGSPPPRSALAALVADRPAMRRLGLAYVAVSGEADPAAIERALEWRLAASGPIGGHGLAPAINRAISEDFAHARTVMVDGWLLAETECRLCALTALTA